MKPRNRDATLIGVLLGAAALCTALLPPHVPPPPPCGPSPLAPGWTASIDARTVTLDVADYAAITNYHHRVSVWSDCIEGRSRASR